MSEIKRRTKNAEPQSENQAGQPARKQTQVTLSKDVSSKYRKIMPKGPAKKTTPKPAAGRRQSPADEDTPRPRRQSSTSRDGFAPAKSRGRAPEKESAPRRPYSSGPKRPGGTLAARRTSAPKARPGGGHHLEMRAIIHRELPEAIKQVRAVQSLILNTAHDMLTLTEAVGDIHTDLDKTLDAILEIHGHLGETLNPFKGHVRHVRELLTKLLEKMSFQDLAGQRLAKVESFFTALNQVLRETASNFSGKPAPVWKKTADGKPPARSKTVKPGRMRSDAPGAPARHAGLKGPLAAGEGLDQNDVDRLLANL